MLVIAITGVMTSVSMYLYTQSGASGLDLSRPGFSAARENTPNDRPVEFPDTGPLGEDDLAQFRKLYQEQRDYLQSLGTFDDDALSDESLGFMFEQEPMPEDVQ